MRARVGGISQIESDVTIIETSRRNDDIGALRFNLGDQLRLHDIEKVGGPAEESQRRRLIVRRHQPDHLIGNGPAPIIRAVCLKYDP